MTQPPADPPAAPARRRIKGIPNGPGWGGPAKGSSARGEKQPPFEVGNQVARGYHDMSRSERLAALDERKWLIGMGMVRSVLPVEVMALNSYEDRHIGKAIARQEHSGPDGAPIPTSLIVGFRKSGV